ncbi:unnamed protein product, partial [Rotaria sordida]
MHPSSTSNDEIQKLFQSKKYNEKLLAKLYWDYRDSYNLTSRVSAQMEKEIRCTSSTKSYEPIWESCYSHSTNYSPLRLVDHLYSSGDVNLKDSEELGCFPLSRWLKDEYQLKNIWIGLFKFAKQLKTVESDHKKDDIEQFEMLLDFLHYISGKCSSQPFYLQMLKSILKSPTVTLRSVSYPAFTRYANIEEMSFQSHRINLGNLGHNKRSIALQELQDCFVKKCTYKNKNLPLEHLTESWKKFNLTEEYEKEFPSVEEINQFLDVFRQESIEIWDELVKSITITNELLFKIGLMLRILPTTLISVVQQKWLND